MLYTFLRGIAKYFIAPFFPVRLVGSKKIPDGCLLCSNHISNWDPIFIAVKLKNKLHFMAKSELFEIKPLLWVFKRLNMFPVRRGENDISAIKSSVKVLKEGKNLLLFPQGTRTMGKKPDPADAKAGVGLIASNTGVDIVPVAVYNKDYRIRFFRPVYIIVGKTITKDEYMHYSGGDKRKIAEYVFIKINEELESFEKRHSVSRNK